MDTHEPGNEGLGAPPLPGERRTILVVEDDKAILKLLRDVLAEQGHVVLQASTARSGLVEAGSRRPDLAILDLGLPDLDGKEFLRDLRTWSRMPVLVLSARGAETEKVLALDMGADDYLSKPFGVPELLARIRSLLRRHQGALAESGPCFRLGSVRLDLAARTARREGETIHLTPVEFKLLAELVRGEGRILTQSHLLREVWGPSHSAHSHYLRIFLARLRRKLEIDPAQPRHLLTEIGVGYRCICEREESPATD